MNKLYLEIVKKFQNTPYSGFDFLRAAHEGVRSNPGFYLLSSDPLLSFRRNSLGWGLIAQNFLRDGVRLPIFGPEGPQSAQKAPY